MGKLFVLLGVPAADKTPMDMTRVSNLLENLKAPAIWKQELRPSNPISTRLSDDAPKFGTFSVVNIACEAQLSDFVRKQQPVKDANGQYVQIIKFVDHNNYAVCMFLFLLLQQIEGSTKDTVIQHIGSGLSSESFERIVQCVPAATRDNVYPMLSKTAKRAVRGLAAAGGILPSSWPKSTAIKHNSSQARA